MLWSKTKTLYQKGTIDSFYVSNGNVKIRLQENAPPITISHTHDFMKYIPRVDLIAVIYTYTVICNKIWYNTSCAF